MEIDQDESNEAYRKASVLSEYHRLRAKGWPAADCWRSAKVRVAFRELEGAWDDDGLVRLRAVPDEELYDDSYIDTWDESDARKNKYKKELWATIDSWGVWGLVGEYRVSEDDAWEHADSCWGFLGNDLKDNAYDIAIMAATLRAYEEAALQARCEAFAVTEPVAEGWVSEVPELEGA